MTSRSMARWGKAYPADEFPDVSISLNIVDSGMASLAYT